MADTDFNMTPEYKQISRITANNVALRDQYIIVGGETIQLPQPIALIAYLARVRETYKRWADLPEESSEPLYDAELPPDRSPDDYLPVDARPLPMRVAEFRDQPMQQEPQAQELLDAVGNTQRTVILGEPGSGKTTALERLAWVTANQTLQRAAEDAETRLVIPIFARLADFQGEADLLPLLRRLLSRNGIALASDMTVRATLQATDAQFVLLLDGLNELSHAHREQGLGAVNRHIQEFDRHTVHLTCRTADFDQAQAAARLPDDTALWEVQPLADAIRHWGDEEGESDVRAYLRRHLGDGRGRRLYERLQVDDRLHSLARLPLFLFMFKEVAGSGDGDLPANRGELVQRFVRSDRILHHVPKDLRKQAVRSLEALAWQMQQIGSLEIDEDTLLDVLDDVRGKRDYSLTGLQQALQRTGLLVALNGSKDTEGDDQEEHFRLLHQLVQEFGAAAYLAEQDNCAEDLPKLAQQEWWRESCILALWLRKALQTPDYLFSVMGDPQIDVRVRVAAGEILGQAGDPRFERRRYASGVEAIEPEMIAIPAGLATLGGEDPHADDDERSECPVWVDAFDLAVYPVTNAEFRCFVEARGYDDESLWTEGGRSWLHGEGKLDAEAESGLRDFYRSFSNDVEAWIARTRQTEAMDDAIADEYRWSAANRSEDEYVNAYAEEILGEQRREPYYWHDSRLNQPNQPVVGVNWYEAMAYAAWLGRVTGQGYSLPTEAEWEWAARRNERRYPWPGDWDPNRCNWRASRLNRPNPVGVYPHGATPEGLHELAGNVYEWTLSLYRAYEYDPGDGREDPDVDGRRVVRGGSWYTDRNTVRCAYRDWHDVGRRSFYDGFRLARTSL
jgi:formylglycine-generating enzyme required for sulfatase activity